MNPTHDHRSITTRRTLLGAIAALTIVIAPSLAQADRLDDFKMLDAEYKATIEKYWANQPNDTSPTVAESIRNYEQWPGWEYLPRVVALAEGDPTDDVAYQCCLWIRDRTGETGNDDQAIFYADQKAWQIIAAHHATGNRVPQLCLDATGYPSPMREDFLRGLIKQNNLTKEHAGFATLALAELLMKTCDALEITHRESKRPQTNAVNKFIKSREAPESSAYLVKRSTAELRAESSKLLRDVLDRYSDVPWNIENLSYKGFATLGQRAEQQLYAVEHLSLGAQAPDIVGKDFDGKPLELKNYRGRVVLLSFWFTGCGPCMAMIPEERKMVESFHDRPFALLGVCGNSSLETARQTAKDEKIDWPCWFDGDKRNGPIDRQYNVAFWPRFFLIDQNGRIADKNMNREYLADDIAELLDKTK